MGNLYHSLIRASAFLGKEIAEVIRQPRLILSLVLGPFLILLLFGIGYKNEPRSVRTLFVADPNGPLAKQIQEQASTISPQLIYVGVVPDEQTALSRLRQGNVDLVAVAPRDAYQTIRSNKQAVFALYHNEIDPAQAGYIEYLGQIYVDEVNRRVLMSMVQQSQTESVDIQKEIKDARANSAGMRQALQAGDTQSARMYQQRMNTNISNLSTIMGASAALLSGVEQNVGSSGDNSGNSEILKTLADLQRLSGDPSNVPANQADTSAEISRLDKADQDLDRLEQQLAEFQRISPDVLVRPFAVETHSVSTIAGHRRRFFHAFCNRPLAPAYRGDHCRFINRPGTPLRNHGAFPGFSGFGDGNDPWKVPQLPDLWGSPGRRPLLPDLFWAADPDARNLAKLCPGLSCLDFYLAGFRFRHFAPG